MFDSFIRTGKKFFLIRTIIPKIKKARQKNIHCWVEVKGKKFYDIKTESGINNILDEKGIPSFVWEKPEEVEVHQISTQVSDEGLTDIIASIQETERREAEEPSDEEMDGFYDENYGSINPSKHNKRREGKDMTYYPAGRASKDSKEWGKKPDLYRIREWVENVKWAGISDSELKSDYNERNSRDVEFGTFEAIINQQLTPKERERHLKTTAYRVARKIWYVGRRPASMTDEQWDDETRDMRPPEGSFSNKEKWVNFKYGVNYKYKSGLGE